MIQYTACLHELGLTLLYVHSNILTPICCDCVFTLLLLLSNASFPMFKEEEEEQGIRRLASLIAEARAKELRTEKHVDNGVRVLPDFRKHADARLASLLTPATDNIDAVQNALYE